ncbi:hypothetical protein [Deinococcus hopiensis]|uniref:Adenylate kinase n=1 Tax=Deinococcus hopiensis KR-140 TaxID=695939 RepID=A0A1W1UKP8_9DEIO|nr:hypothetical protein [Deinococcus hopiensis]SMB81698.1 hypothetical protein SAMN00790413_04685 [Deinococcus hopiensis KR-140]
MLFVISGASGSGKSTILPLLREAHPSVQWHDFDERWQGGGKVERQQLLEQWVQTALQAEGDFGLLGQCPLGEVLAAPSTSCLAGIRHLLLDVADVERIRRLRGRGDGLASQDMLNWAAWMRAHEAYPDWRPDVLMEDSWDLMCWGRWHERPGVPWPGATFDVTELTPDRTAQRVLTWATNPAAPI